MCGEGQGPEQLRQQPKLASSGLGLHKGIVIPSNPVLEGDKAGTARLCAEQLYTGRVLHMEGFPAACALLLEWKDTKALQGSGFQTSVAVWEV